MNTVHVAAAVLNQTPLDWMQNLANVTGALREAREAGVAVLCLPEMCLTGYGCEDAFHSADTLRRAWKGLEALLPETRGLIACVGLPVLHQNAVFNAAALLVDGRLAGLVAKQFLAGDGLHYEPRWFKAWPSGVIDTFTSPTGQAVPIGDLHFNVGGVRVGFEICEDAWVAARPGATLAGYGVDIILNPSASHFAFGKLEIRKRFVLEGSRAFGVTYLYANLLGNEAGRAIYDGGAIIASGGRLLATGPRFSYRDRALTVASVDLDSTRMSQARTASFRPDLTGDNPACVNVSFVWPAKAGPAGASATGPTAASWETSAQLKEEEFTRAVALGLFDYLRKSRAGGFTVSLSGGADSAAVSCLCAQSLTLALQELGVTGLQEKLGHLKLDLEQGDKSPTEKAGASPRTPNPARALVGALLVTAYQGTENSGSVTRKAARAVADAIGTRHLEFDVTDIHRAYVRLVGEALGRPLEWSTDDIALQNIQARVRSPGVWMLANLTGSLLLATSNRSEAAVGYATMDGDTSGGLSPIAGIDKNFLRQWLRWLERTGPSGLGPIPALSAINVQAPTAELRPPGARQTDEDDLMPYDVLDAVERAAIRDKRPPLEVWQLMQPLFPQHAPATLAVWVERFFRLWSRNQWKRERYAPSFHLDDENLDPKTWCRWPILNGGFELEIAELQAAASKLNR